MKLKWNNWGRVLALGLLTRAVDPFVYPVPWISTRSLSSSSSALWSPLLLASSSSPSPEPTTSNGPRYIKKPAKASSKPRKPASAPQASAARRPASRRSSETTEHHLPKEEPGALPTGPWVTAFKELEGKESRSLEDFVAVFDVCRAEKRPYECLGVLRRMARDDLPRPLSLYVRVMELAVGMGAWGNVLDAYLLLEKKEAHVFEPQGEEEGLVRRVLAMGLEACEKLGKGGRALTIFERSQALVPPMHPTVSARRTLRACVRAGLFDRALPLADLVLSPPPIDPLDSEPAPPLDRLTAHMAVQVYAKGRGSEAAWQALTHLASTPDEASLVVILEAAAVEGCAAIAKQCLDSLETIETLTTTVGSDVLGLALRAACGGGDGEWAEVLMTRLGSCRPPPGGVLWPLPVLHPCICSLAKHGLATQAEALFDLAHSDGTQATPLCYYAVVGAWDKKGGHHEEVMQWVQRMAQDGVALDELRYSMGLKACEALGWWEEGLRLMQDMRTRPDIQGNGLFWKRLLLLLGREGRGDEAMTFLRSLQEDGHTLDPMFYEAVITAYSRAGDRTMALKLLQQWRGVVGRGAYTSAISACRAVNFNNNGDGDGEGEEADWETAWALYQEMKARGLEPTAATRATVLEVLLSSKRVTEAKIVADEEYDSEEEGEARILPQLVALHTQGGQHARALECFRTMLHVRRQRPEGQDTIPWPTCNSALQACAKTGDFELGLSILELLRVQRMPVDVVMYGCVLTACAVAAAWPEAIGLIKDMEGAGLRPNLVCFTSAITACQRGGEWRKALSLFLRMTSHGPRPDVVAHNAVMSACANAGEWQMALKVFQALQSQAGSGESDVAPNDVSYATAVVACWKGDQWRKAVEVLYAMRAQGLNPNMITITLVVDTCERAGRPDVATYVFESTVVGAIRSECYDPCKDGPGMVVDLHGYTQAVARAAVRSGLKRLAQMYMRMGKDGRFIKDFIFITGVGRHSANPFEPVLRPAMMEMLQKDFSPPLPCEPLADNAGRLRVKAQDLVTWIDAQMAPRPLSPAESVGSGAFRLKKAEEMSADFDDFLKESHAAQGPPGSVQTELTGADIPLP